LARRPPRCCSAVCASATDVQPTWSIWWSAMDWLVLLMVRGRGNCSRRQDGCMRFRCLMN